MKLKNFTNLNSSHKVLAGKISFRIYIPHLVCCMFILFIPMLTNSQPSGGPYGPLHQKYELPKVTGKIYFVAPDGLKNNSGESINLPTTLDEAISKVKSGDAIVLRGGIYRTGNHVFNQGITIQPYADEHPV